MRKRSNKGVVTQKMMSFRLDNDNALWLDSMENKGRYLNDLIRLDRKNDMTIHLAYHETMTVKALTWREKNKYDDIVRVNNIERENRDQEGGGR